MKITLGELIKNKRREMGITIQEAADRIEVSKMTYIRLEKDQTTFIPFDNIIRIANELNLDFFRILQVSNKELVNFEFETALKSISIFYYKGELLDTNKLEKLVGENIDGLKRIIYKEI